MQWLRAHPYAILAAGAGIVLIIMAGIVRARIAPAPETGIAATVSSPELLNPGLYQTQAPAVPTSSVSTNADASNDSLPQSTGSGGPTSGAQLAQPAAAPSPLEQSSSAPTTNSDLDSLLSWIYSFTPTTTFSASAAPAQTPAQQALYAYGNAAGQVVENFNNAHPDMAQVLQNWINDRGSSADEAAVAQIGTDMTSTGASLAALTSAPTTAAILNRALAQDYETAGKQLVAVAQAGAQSDADLASAMETYDADADQFTTDYVALVDLFSSYGVQFSQSDPGSVFQFEDTGL